MSLDHASDFLTPATYGSGGITIIAGLSLNEWAAAIGIITTLSLFLLTWYYKHQTLKLAKIKERDK